MPFWCTLEGQYGYGRSVTSGFSPKDITGLNTWYDASDLTTMYDATSGGSLSSNGGRVARWEDKSGNSNNALQIAGQADTTRPVLTFNAQNGRAALQFSTNESRQLNGGTGIYPYDIYMITQTPITSSNFDLIGVGASGSDNFNGFGLNTTNIWNQSSSAGARSYATTPAETSSNFLLIRWTAANVTNAYQTWRNGAIIGTSNFSWTFPSPSIFRIGNRTPNTATTTRAWNGKIGEILIYNNQLSIFNREQVEGYLSWKWGLQSNLYLGHPFRYQAPTTASIPFIPSMVNNLTSWLDASDSNIFSLTGSSITTWFDKSPYVYNVTQSTAALKPLRVSYGSSYSALFYGSNYLATSVAASSLFSVNSRSIFVVGSVSSITTNNSGGTLYANNSFLGDNAGNTNIILRNTTPPIIGAQNYTVNNTSDGAQISFSSNTLNIINYTFGSSNLGIRLNGGTPSTITSANTKSLTSVFEIGRSANNNAYCLRGQIMEVIIYNSSITTSDRQQVEGYLAWKWGIQSSLPSDQPYKNNAPYT